MWERTARRQLQNCHFPLPVIAHTIRFSHRRYTHSYGIKTKNPELLCEEKSYLYWNFAGRACPLLKILFLIPSRLSSNNKNTAVGKNTPLLCPPYPLSQGKTQHLVSLVKAPKNIHKNTQYSYMHKYNNLRQYKHNNKYNKLQPLFWLLGA